MVWALAERKVNLRGFEFELVPADIQTLNEWALDWWLEETALPLPLGVNVVRRDVERVEELSRVLAASIEAGLADRRNALAYAQTYARGLDETTADRFVDMYVNDMTRDYGDEGRRAVEELLHRAQAASVYENVKLDFVGAD